MKTKRYDKRHVSHVGGDRAFREDVADYLLSGVRLHEGSEKPRKLFEVLRQELKLRNYSHKTLTSYRSCLREFVKYFSPRHPRELSNEDIRKYLLHLIEDKHYTAGSINQVFNAIRFLYVELYKRPLVIAGVPRPLKERKLPNVLSQDEVLRIFECVDNLKHKTLLMLIYSAGLRVGESVRLKVSDIDGQRKMIHIHDAKGKRSVTLFCLMLFLLR